MTSSIPNGASAPSVPLSGDEIDDILYIARANELSELKPRLESLCEKYNASEEAILSSAIDPESGNTGLHYASANGHSDLLKALLAHIPRIQPPHPPPTPSAPRPPASLLNHRNKSGNTPLHWAALNGQLPTVQLLVAHGADASILNDAGHDAVYEAEMADKEDVVQFLLKEAQGLETGVGGDGASEDGGVAEEGVPPESARDDNPVEDTADTQGVRNAIQEMTVADR